MPSKNCIVSNQSLKHSLNFNQLLYLLYFIMVVLWYLIYSLLLTVIMIKVLLPTCNETLIINSYVLMKCMVPEVISIRYCL